MNHINQMKVNYTGIKDHGFVQDHRGIYHYFVCSKPWPYKWGKKTDALFQAASNRGN